MRFVAIQWTPAESNPAVPSHITGDIQSGDAVADMPMYKIIIDGLNIVEVQKVFSEAPNITELNRKLFLDGYFFVDFGSLPNSTTKLVDTDIPNVATHYWIVAGWAKTRGGNGSYTLPYIDPNNWNNSIRVLLNANRQIEVTTTTDWSGYPAYFIVAYKL